MYQFACFLLIILCNFVTATDLFYPLEYTVQLQNYPNIMQSKELCLPLKGNYHHPQTLVCDPAKLFTVDQINQLNSKLYEIKGPETGDGNACNELRPRPVVAVALVNRMKVGNVDPDRLLSYAATFSYYLFRNWNLPQNCRTKSDKVIILYSKEDRVIYTFAGDLLKQKLPVSFITNTAVQSRVPFSTSIYDGIAYVVDRYGEAVKMDRFNQ